jgi:hypothetical protein
MPHLQVSVLVPECDGFALSLLWFCGELGKQLLSWFVLSLTMREAITHWNQYRYLKMRHQLVELRREQYTLRDSYSQTVLPQGAITPIVVEENPQIDCDITVLPLGTKNTSNAALLVF